MNIKAKTKNKKEKSKIPHCSLARLNNESKKYKEEINIQLWSNLFYLSYSSLKKKTEEKGNISYFKILGGLWVLPNFIGSPMKQSEIFPFLSCHCTCYSF